MIRDKIIEFLKKKSEYVSGEELSQRLGISRQAFWKHIHELKESGYDIVAVPHLGYRLEGSPDRLFPSEISSRLNTKFTGRKIYYFDTLPSTIDVAIDLGIKGAPEGTLVLAESQTKGRGRLGREWFSPKYKGIYMSLILRPDILPAQASIFTLLAGVSVCEAAGQVCAIEAKIKWPNDILVNNKKLGGILTELNAEMDEVHFLVVSMGLNVNNDKKSLPVTAISLKELKKENVSRIELLQEILRKIEANYMLLQKKGNALIIDKWREYNITLGLRVKISSHHKQVEGEAVDIDADGSLLIRNDAGLTQKITAGDVAHCR
jgi:BirA family biotin operon repressor/biotin-[acetyl-CoA-carboxylase] ligase